MIGGGHPAAAYLGGPGCFRRCPRVLAFANVVAAVAPMGQSGGFVEFARHGLKAAHYVVAALEQATAKHVMQPANVPRR
jgi:hypothetical protein